MADNKNKGYSTGSNSSFDLFSEFDAIEAAERKAEKKETKPEIIKTEAPKAKKSPLFGIICAVLSIAIVVCGAVSVSNISKSKKTDISGEASDDSGFNIYRDMVAKYNTTKYPQGIQQSLARAYASNNDLVGWLYIPGTAVNTPVVQGKDNTKYLRYNFFGKFTTYGTTYADYRCKTTELTANTVIYGHNMPSGTHFYDVSRYEDIEWYRQHPVIKYSTLYGDYTYLVYAAFYTTAQTKYNGGYFFNYIYPNMGPTSVAGYIKEIDERAIYKTGISASGSDKLITLSTCTHSLDAACGRDIDGRLVVVGRLLRAGESENVDTSRAQANPDYRRPQIWYDHRGKVNPFAKQVTWVPSAK